MPNSPSRMLLSPTFGRMTPELPVRSSSLANLPRSETVSEIGSLFGTTPSRVGSRILTSLPVSNTTALSNRSAAIMRNRPPLRRLLFVSGERLARESHEELGTRPVLTHTPRILAPNFGVDTMANLTSSSMSFEEALTSPTYFAGWTGTPYASRRRVPLSYSSAQESGSPPTSTQDNGSPDLTSPHWMLCYGV